MTDESVSPGPQFLRRLPDIYQLLLIAILVLVPLGYLIAGVALNLNPGPEALGGILALLALGFYLAISWARSGMRMIKRTTGALQFLAEGRFDTRLSVSGADSRRALAVAFNDMARSVERRLAQTAGVLEEVTHAVGELQTSAKRVDDAAAHQRDAATSTAAAMEEMTVSLGEVADQTRDTERRAADASQLASDGGKTLATTTQGLVGLAATIKDMADSMLALRDRSAEISEVSQLIRSIAEQTNLLALNAAIEAARAGEHGRGFAVVADEVRSLAMRSRSSAETITNVIGAIQEEIRDAVAQMGEASEEADANVTHIGVVVESLEDIHKRVHAALDSVGLISINTQQQREVSLEIAKHVEQISGNAWENSAAAHETAEVASYLDQLSRRLRQAQMVQKPAASAV